MYNILRSIVDVLISIALYSSLSLFSNDGCKVKSRNINQNSLRSKTQLETERDAPGIKFKVFMTAENPSKKLNAIDRKLDGKLDKQTSSV